MKLIHVVHLTASLANAVGDIVLQENTGSLPDPPFGFMRRLRISPDTGSIVVLDIPCEGIEGAETLVWTYKRSLGKLIQLPLPPWMPLPDREMENPEGRWTTPENAAKLMGEYTREVYRVIDQDRKIPG